MLQRHKTFRIICNTILYYIYVCVCVCLLVQTIILMLTIYFAHSNTNSYVRLPQLKTILFSCYIIFK